jgi:peptidylprolyl isomerase
MKNFFKIIIFSIFLSLSMAAIAQQAEDTTAEPTTNDEAAKEKPKSLEQPSGGVLGEAKPSEKAPEKVDEKNNAAVKADDKTLSNLENTIYIDLKDGRVVIELLPDVAPNHVTRFKELVRQKFYDNSLFHRVIEGFMAQTGDPTGTGRGGSGQNIKAEFSTEKHVRGTVSMARAMDPDSADSQFFICFDEAPHLDGQYTVFGKVVKGMEFVDKIKKGTGPNGKVTDPDKIIKIQVAADTNEAYSAPNESAKTDGSAVVSSPSTDANAPVESNIDTKTEEPVADTQKTTPEKVEAAPVEEKSPEIVKPDATKSEPQKDEATKTEAEKPVEVKADEPKKEEPKKEEPKEEKVLEKKPTPKAEEPKKAEPKKEAVKKAPTLKVEEKKIEAPKVVTPEKPVEPAKPKASKKDDVE